MCNHAQTEWPVEGRHLTVEVPADWGRDLESIRLPLKDVRCVECGHTWLTVGKADDSPEDIAGLRSELMLRQMIQRI
jgi:hypothetical protein